MGVGKALQDKNRMEQAAENLTQITGQRAQIRKAKVAISGFRLRENNEIGCRVTLRGRRMYEFLDRLISVALPRIRDFRGVNPKSFDGNGNYSMGLSEQICFRDRPRQGDLHAGHGRHLVTSTPQGRRSAELLKLVRQCRSGKSKPTGAPVRRPSLAAWVSVEENTDVHDRQTR
jgi:large subunit ribosomal protein L5